MNNEQILNILQIQPLSEEEKNRRHILGRLYGPIATGKESTRNERYYNDELWQKAINDEVFKEKIANKSLFLELGHPADREETDMSKACACIPEMPKTINGDLYTYVDILDTPNGKILKTLIDYGFIPGISSRGSGDVDMNNEVDPETFYLETWDIVQLPALKKARMAVYESLEKNKSKMIKALTESINTSDEKDREIMKESLKNLKINIGPKTIKESLKGNEFTDLVKYCDKLGIIELGELQKIKKYQDIAKLDDSQFVKALEIATNDTTDAEVKEKINNAAKKVLGQLNEAFGEEETGKLGNSTAEILRALKGPSLSSNSDTFESLEEDVDLAETIAAETDDYYILSSGPDRGTAVSTVNDKPIAELNNAITQEEGITEDLERDIQDAVENEVDEMNTEDQEIIEPTEDETVEAEIENIEDVEGEENADTETFEEITDAQTVGELVDTFKDYDSELAIEFNPISIEDKEYTITGLVTDDSEEGKIIVSIECNPAETEEDEADTDNEDEEDDELSELNDVIEDDIEDEETDSDEVAEDDGTIEEAISSLKEMVRLKESLEVEIKKLKNAKVVQDKGIESLKEEVQRYKDSFARTGELAAGTKKANKKLQEQLDAQNTQLEKLGSKNKTLSRLSESMKIQAQEVDQLKEQLKKTKDDQTKIEAELNQKCEAYKKKFNESLNAAKVYKEKFAAVLNHYIESKAMALGVKPSEITNRLNESYSLADIDNVCDSLLDCNVAKLPFATTNRVRINESKQGNIKKPQTGDYIDDSLFDLAGLDRKQFKF